MSPLQYPFCKLPKLGRDCILWTAKFYNPKHSDRERLDRLEAQARIVMRMATSLKHTLQYQGRNQCLRTEAVKDRIQRNLTSLIMVYKSSQWNSDSEEEEEEEDEFRIACLFMRKRHLLHIILFIFANEPHLAERHKRSMKELIDLVEEDTTDWMEILDYVQTMRNPTYIWMKTKRNE